uniref:Taste receptor type 2 n=1 Tax=Leptobrachium leishanense TaxID=445787 RepID=A0A8C5WM61_9ANUR
MEQTLEITLMLIYSLLVVAGIIGNLFIFILNVMNWRRKRLSSFDILVSNISFSNILLHCLITVFCLFAVLSVRWDNFYTSDGTIDTLMFTCKFLLFSTCFLWLKVRLPKTNPGSLLVSLAVSLPSYWDIHMILIADTHFSGNENDTMFTTFSYHFESRCHCLLYMYILLSSLAFTMFFFLTLGIIISLCKHMWRIQINNDGVSSIDAHLTAAKTLTALLLLYIYFFAAVSYLFNISSIGTNPVFFYCLLMISSFPLLNALILIMGNPKLRTSLKNLLLTLLWIYWVII